MNYSILNSVKKMLGLAEDYTPFDTDIILHINTVFSILFQMGIGSDTAFSITDSTSKWSDFLGDVDTIEMIKSYMYLKVRLLFDPPTTGGVKEAIENSVKELEYRIYVSEQNRKEYKEVT